MSPAGLEVAVRAHAAPAELEITQRMIDWLDTVPGNMAIDMVYETEKFLDYHRAKGTKFVDWTAAWRNWMRRAVEWAPKRGSKEALNAVTPQAVLTLFDE